ncbi:hypothetical protein ABET36_05650 [Caldifermentibacillus hisashii]|uniref:hypothetical protein n=1 Tax=Caldifermentibacillus hisashii TaxID=996558 RepID=UPI003D25F7BC
MSLFREKLEAANELKQGSTAFYRERAEQARREIGQAKLNRDYSAEGRQKLAAQLRRKHANELMQAAAQRKQEYIKLLTDAKTYAESTIKRKLKEPSDAANFKKEIERLKVEIMLAPNAEKATEKIDATMKKINDPYHAVMIADSFAEIVPQVLSLAGDTGKAKTQLSQMYERLNNDYLPDEVKEARSALEYIDSALENPKLFPPVVEANAEDIFNRDVARNINTPENYEPSDEEITEIGKMRL